MIFKIFKNIIKLGFLFFLQLILIQKYFYFSYICFQELIYSQFYFLNYPREKLSHSTLSKQYLTIQFHCAK